MAAFANSFVRKSLSVFPKAAEFAPHPPAGTLAGPSLKLRAFVIRNDSPDRFVGCADHSSPPF
ncbi:hypothetical protein [Rhizobium sp. CAU 1783]